MRPRYRPLIAAVANILAELELPRSPALHRRVLAVVAYLAAR